MAGGPCDPLVITIARSLQKLFIKDLGFVRRNDDPSVCRLSWSGYKYHFYIHKLHKWSHQPHSSESLWLETDVFLTARTISRSRLFNFKANIGDFISKHLVDGKGTILSISFYCSCDQILVTSQVRRSLFLLGTIEMIHSR